MESCNKDNITLLGIAWITTNHSRNDKFLLFPREIVGLLGNYIIFRNCMELSLGTARIYVYIYINVNNVIILRKFLEDNEDSQKLSHDKNHILMIGINLTKTFS